jgi:hypothetical protein
MSTVLHGYFFATQRLQLKMDVSLIQNQTQAADMNDAQSIAKPKSNTASKTQTSNDDEMTKSSSTAIR